MFADELKLLQSLPRFKDTDPAKLRLLAVAANRMTFQPGDTLMREGEPGKALFILMFGECEAARIVDGERVVFGTVTPGTILGEAAVMLNRRHVVTITAKTTVTALRFERGAYLDLIQRVPQMAMAMIEDLSERVLSLGERYSKLLAARQATETDHGR
jgi:CRP-like cAMP-binding protein